MSTAIGTATRRLAPIHWTMIACASFPAPALAECVQERAIYGDTDGAYELRFEPLESEAAAASNRFKVAVLKTPLMLDGYVMYSDQPAQSNGIILFNCPGGDVTGAELSACTVWQGTIFASDEAGNTDVLPPEGTNAAARLLLPDFGPAVRKSSIWGEGKATVAPSDVLTFKGCAQ